MGPRSKIKNKHTLYRKRDFQEEFLEISGGRRFEADNHVNNFLERKGFSFLHFL